MNRTLENQLNDERDQQNKIMDDDFELGTACGLSPEECESCQ